MKNYLSMIYSDLWNIMQWKRCHLHLYIRTFNICSHIWKCIKGQSISGQFPGLKQCLINNLKEWNKICNKFYLLKHNFYVFHLRTKKNLYKQNVYNSRSSSYTNKIHVSRKLQSSLQVLYTAWLNKTVLLSTTCTMVGCFI